MPQFDSQFQRQIGVDENIVVLGANIDSCEVHRFGVEPTMAPALIAV